MSEEKILSGEAGSANEPEAIISGEHGSTSLQEEGNGKTTQKDRLGYSTAPGGLKELPVGFDQLTGDWNLINSANPFEVLYFDYKQYRFITPQLVENNYGILKKFWENKVALMNTGGNRIAFKNKYGDGTVENSLHKLKKAFEKIVSTDGIQQYYIEINDTRLKAGQTQLMDSIEHMLMDGVADRLEIQLCLDRGLKYDLIPEETAVIIKNSMDAASFLPYGVVNGSALVEQLLSVDSWMTHQKKEEAERYKKERETARIQILPGKYVNTTEEIGTVLFEDAEEGRKLIKDDLTLLQHSIAQKDIVLAREVGNLGKTNKDTDAAFLSIVYKLNKNLPYRFALQKFAKNTDELCRIITESELAQKQGKEQFKKGYIEIWLKEANPDAYKVFLIIRDTAEDLDTAFLRFLYTFCPALPYRFAGKIIVKTPQELCVEINKNEENWEAGKKELFSSWIPVWLGTIKQHVIVNAWNKVKDNFTSHQDSGLESFLHILNNELPHAELSIDVAAISYPKIQSGHIITTELNFKNTTRGYLEAFLKFSKDIPGIYLSEEKIVINNSTGVSTHSIILSIDSQVQLKGVSYTTSLIITTFEQQQIEIPIDFKIVFPKNAFIIEITKYAIITAVFFLLIRALLATEYPTWLGKSFNAFMDLQGAFQYFYHYPLFGWAFFLFAGGLGMGGYFMIKYLVKK